MTRTSGAKDRRADKTVALLFSFVFFFYLAIQMRDWLATRAILRADLNGECPFHLLAHLASASGGALLVTMWFLIARSHLSKTFAWIFAVTLIVAPMIWMSALNALPETLAAGLFAGELWSAFRFRETRRVRDFWLLTFFGTTAAAAQPMVVPIALLVIAQSLWTTRAEIRRWVVVVLPLVAAWVAFQTQTWSVSGPSRILVRVMDEIPGWFGQGLGFSQSIAATVGGAILVIVSLLATLRRTTRSDRALWKFLIPWTVLHVAFSLCFLPPHQSYYLPIFPPVLLGLTLGLSRLPNEWRFAAAVWPIFLAALSAPLAMDNAPRHASFCRTSLYLEKIYPEPERQRILLLRKKSDAFLSRPSDFDVRDEVVLNEVDAETLNRAVDVFTDNSELEIPAGWSLQPVMQLQNNATVLYEIKLPESDVGDQIILKPKTRR